MVDPLTPQEMEALAKARGLTVAQLCDRAGVAHTTFTRWRAGRTQLRLDVYRRFQKAIEAAEMAPETPKSAQGVAG